MHRPHSQHIRVVTWNIHGCIGTDRLFDPERTAGVIRRLGPDIIALQEVDSRRRWKDGFDIFSYLSNTVGAYMIDAKTISVVDGHYGQMLISRWPLRHQRVHEISVGEHEPRKVLEADVALPDGRLHVIATHLGLRADERRLQFQTLAEISRSRTGMPQVLLGDMNEWRRRGWGYRLLSTVFESCTSHRTFPAKMPLLPLDRIWCRPASLMVRSWTEHEARRVSDHLPLAADLAFQQAS